MKTAQAAAKAAQPKYEIATAVCRKISTKNDEDAGFSIYVGQAPILSFIDLPEDENVREYIPGSGAINRRTEVHTAIAESLREKPATFNVLNGGIVIVASNIEMLDDQKRIRLTNPSIINGSQTRGEIRNFIASLDSIDSLANVKFEIIVTNDEDLIADISIARNFQIKVQAISIYGKKGYFEDLAKAFVDSSGKNRSLRTSETDRKEGVFLPTEKLIQVITALIPEKLWPLTGKSGDFWNKAFAYSSAQTPLKLYGQNYEKAKKGDPEAIKLHKFYLDICSDAWSLYEKWVSHPGFEGSGLKNGYGLERDEKGNITRIYDGMIFPIIAAFSSFVVQKDDKWVISPPSNWNDKFLIDQAKRLFTSRDVGSNPQTMGKMASCYSGLNALTSMANSMN